MFNLQFPCCEVFSNIFMANTIRGISSLMSAAALTKNSVQFLKQLQTKALEFLKQSMKHHQTAC